MDIVFECECHERVLGKNIGNHIKEKGQLGHSHFAGIGTTDNQILGGI
jgi:hypothetical protein